MRDNVTPTGVERTFRDDEIIVSKTDTKGRLTYVNRLFMEISGYTEDELIGKPHNVIRHPDMPRCVFKLLWDRIQAGEELFAYVMNMGSDGAHYWVLAHITPTFERGRLVGFHSNRRTADPVGLVAIKDLYDRLLAEERRHPNKADGIAAGERLLAETLEGTGMSYDEFIWSLETQEAAA